MPVDVNAVAPHVASTMPHIQQVFIDIRLIETPAKPLYIARKQIEQYAERQDLGFISQVYRIRQLFIKVGYVQIKLRNYI